MAHSRPCWAREHEKKPRRRGPDKRCSSAAQRGIESVPRGSHVLAARSHVLLITAAPGTCLHVPAPRRLGTWAPRRSPARDSIPAQRT